MVQIKVDPIFKSGSSILLLLFSRIKLNSINVKKIALCTVGLALAAFLLLFLAKPAWITSVFASAKFTAATLGEKSAKSTDTKSISNIQHKAPVLVSGINFRSANRFDTELRRKYIQSLDLYKLFTELQNKTDSDSLFFRAMVLQSCQGNTQTYSGDSVDVRHQRMIDSFKGKHLEQRRALLADSKPHNVLEKCKTFPTSITETDVNNAFKLAAGAGDPRSQLADVFNTILNNGVKVTPAELAGLFPDAAIQNSPMPVVPIGPSKEQLEQIKTALATRDPSQILFAGPLLTAMYSEYTLEFGGSNGKAIRHDDQLWVSVACHFGDGCDVNNPRVVDNCIRRDWCDVGSYDQMLQRYVIPQEKWDQFQRDRHTLITAIENKDWSLLREVRGPMTNASGTYLLLTPPRFRFRF
jgi:hypothetical protein